MNGVFYVRAGKVFHVLLGDMKLCSCCLKR